MRQDFLAKYLMRLPIPKTLNSRLILSHLLVAMVSITLISIYAGQAMYTAARRQFENSIEDLAYTSSNALEEPLMDYLSGRDSANQVRSVAESLLSNKSDLGYTIYLPDGVPLVAGGGELLPGPATTDAPEVWEAIQGITGRSKRIHTNAQGIEMLYFAVRIEHSDQIYGVVRLEIPKETALNTARRSLGLLLLTALLVAGSVSVVGYLLARSLAKPIENLTQTAEQLSRGDLDARTFTPTGPLEMHRLSRAFNNMAGRLQANVDEARSFVANASHELRTPLTSIKLRVEALRHGALDEPEVTDQFLAEIESEVDRLSRMVGDLLDLSRIETGLTSHEREPLDLAVIVREVHETFKTRAVKSEVTLDCRIEPGIHSIMGLEDQMRRMLYNLVDNAIKYTSHGGCVDIILRAEEHGNTIRLIVKDTGFGIAAANLPHIFERFYRAEATRPRYGLSRGSGLGLAITRTIVETHGGKIGVTSQAGKGTTFWVELPAHQEVTQGD